MVISSVNKDNFMSFFLLHIPLISFSCVIAKARTSSVILKSGGQREHPILVPHLSGKVCSFSPLSVMLGLVFLKVFSSS